MDQDLPPQTDPTHTVDLTDPVAVHAAIEQIMSTHEGWAAYRGVLAQAIRDLTAAFTGDYPGLLPCDTWYHDLRHALDSALAMARLLEGYRKAQAAPALSAEQAVLGLVLALFHDIGMLRRTHEAHMKGAELTLVHEARSVEFTYAWLSQSALAHRADYADIIMVTRLASPMPSNLPPIERALANLMGTGDLMAQLADRYYLEKSRDFLFIELSTAGLAGTPASFYPTPEVLLEKTPAFYAEFLRHRLDIGYERANRYMQVFFDGACPYSTSIERNFRYLDELLAQGKLTEGLRRLPQRLLAASFT